MPAPSPFAAENPNLQVAWDATSLKSLMTCPRKYQYEILQGYRGSKVDLEFGIFFAEAMEEFLKAQLRGLSKEQATLAAVTKALEISGEYELSANATASHGPGASTDFIPWGGTYEEMWHCLGTEPYKNKKGNKAKCPFSHKGKWFMGEGPSVCGECGSATISDMRYLPTNPAKNRKTLLRLVVWFCDEQVELGGVGIQPYQFPNGKPAVELSFKIPLPFTTPGGQPYILAGHMDSIKQLGDELFVADNKTSKNALSSVYWQQYSPNVQVDTYDLAGSLLFPDLPLKGVVIEAAQTLVHGARFGRHEFRRTEAQREEWLNEIGYWLKMAEKYAKEEYWPMNRSACFSCQFKKVCSRDPAMREQSLKADFTVNKWNPLEER